MPRKAKVSASAAAAESAFQEDYGHLFRSQTPNNFRAQADIKSQMDVSRVVSPVDTPSRNSTASPMQGVVGTAPMVKGQRGMFRSPSWMVTLHRGRRSMFFVETSRSSLRRLNNVWQGPRLLVP